MGTLKDAMGAWTGGGVIPSTAGGAADASISRVWAATQMSMAGDLLGGLSGFQVGRFQQAIARNNAARLEQAARDAKTSGEYSLFNQQMGTRHLLAQQTAAYAANGVDVSVGSPVDQHNATELLGALDADTIRYNTLKEVYGYEMQASSARMEGKMAGMAATNALLNGITNANTSFIAGSQSVADKRAALARSGAIAAKGPAPDTYHTHPGTLAPRVSVPPIATPDMVSPTIRSGRTRRF